MHFEILVEDQSGKKALDVLVPKIIGNEHTFRVIAYKGVGHIPKSMTTAHDTRHRFLLYQLPKLLQGYGHAFNSLNYTAALIVVFDLDDKCLNSIRDQLKAVLENCDPKPDTRFCLAIEEGEAWLLGDTSAVITAYPKAKKSVLSHYINDSICGTWECLADAIYPGGAKYLSAKGWTYIGTAKSVWAEMITPHMNIDRNASPSFRYFVKHIKELAGYV